MIVVIMHLKKSMEILQADHFHRQRINVQNL